MSKNPTDKARREFLSGATLVLGGVGASFAAIPFLSAFKPSAKAKAIGAPVEANLKGIEPGQRIIVQWRGKPVWIVRRTTEQIEALSSFDNKTLQDPDSNASDQPDFAKNAWRSKDSEFLVLVGICTHLGCSPNFFPGMDNKSMGADWKGGSIVLVMVQNLILPVAYMQEFPLQQICQYRLTNFYPKTRY